MGSARLTRIDRLVLPDYHYLTEDDECYFLREYTSHAGYQHSETNGLVFNFKKSVDRRGRPEWKYKEHAIAKLAGELRDAIVPTFLRTATLVPMPPSKIKNEPLYDDRLLRLLQAMTFGAQADVRELLVRRASASAAHGTTLRPSPIDIENEHEVDANLMLPRPRVIALFDDVLTTGAHFRAACHLFARAFPGVKVIGFFVARRIFHDAYDEA